MSKLLIRKRHVGIVFFKLMLILFLIGLCIQVLNPYLVKIKVTYYDNLICDPNRIKLEKAYDEYLSYQTLKDTNANFKNFLQNNYGMICPSGGQISHNGNEVICSLHSD